MTINIPSAVGLKGLGSDPCVENFWSAACWFGSTGAQALGVDASAGTIAVKPPPVSTCAGTLNADGSCSAAGSVNDPNGSAANLPASNTLTSLEQWAAGLSNSANVGTNNTVGSGSLWLIGGALVLLMFIGGKR